MSEPSSLYARFSLTKPQYEAVMASLYPVPGAFDDWQAWFDSQEMYGGSVIDPQILNDTDTSSVAEFVQAWQEEPWCAAKSSYDEVNQVWQFVVLQLSENYYDMLYALSSLRGVAKFNKPDADDFILIYPFMWDPGFNAYMTFQNGESHFATSLPDQHKEEADRFLQEHMEKVSAEFDD